MMSLARQTKHSGGSTEIPLCYVVTCLELTIVVKPFGDAGSDVKVVMETLNARWNGELARFIVLNKQTHFENSQTLIQAQTLCYHRNNFETAIQGCSKGSDWGWPQRKQLCEKLMRAANAK